MAVSDATTGASGYVACANGGHAWLPPSVQRDDDTATKSYDEALLEIVKILEGVLDLGPKFRILKRSFMNVRRPRGPAYRCSGSAQCF